eukprot:gene3130-607_t
MGADANTSGVNQSRNNDMGEEDFKVFCLPFCALCARVVRCYYVSAGCPLLRFLADPPPTAHYSSTALSSLVSTSLPRLWPASSQAASIHLSSWLPGPSPLLPPMFPAPRCNDTVTCQAQCADTTPVIIRIRPPLPREKMSPGYAQVTRVEYGNTVTIAEHLESDDGRGGGIFSSQGFTFDSVFDMHVKQREVYERCAKPLVMSVLQGYNATIIAYGQTGTGKTYTMEGFEHGEHRGIVPRATEDIFTFMTECPDPNTQFFVRASYLQIYNEVVSDLLKDQNNLAIHQNAKGVVVEGLSMWIVRSCQDIYGLIAHGNQRRVTGSTCMSEMSSRSHAIFIIYFEARETSIDANGMETSSLKMAKLNLVDLAGSEKVRQTRATGQRLEECKKINRSLSALGNVIQALTSGASHIPYRDVKLTSILKDSLGGNCKTTMICMVTPALESYHESVSTLKFAKRAKSVKNLATVNEDLDQGSLIRRHEREIKHLRELLRQAGFPDPRQMGGGAGAPGQGDRVTHLEQEVELRDRLLQDTRRQAADEERQAVHLADKYKTLLLKQRDIMIALTARLNEKDESILGLQEEIDAYDMQHRLMEEMLDRKTANLVPIESGSSLGHSGSSHDADSPAGSSSAAVLSPEEKVRILESRCDALKWQHNQFKQEAAGWLEEKRLLGKQLEDERSAFRINTTANHEMKSVKTILEYRIKTRVDSLGQVLGEHFDSLAKENHVPAPQSASHVGHSRQRVEEEIGDVPARHNAHGHDMNKSRPREPPPICPDPPRTPVVGDVTSRPAGHNAHDTNESGLGAASDD